MSYTYSTSIGDGIAKSFQFSLAGQDEGYISVSNLHVFVAGVEVEFSVISSSPNVVNLKTAPPVGAEVLIRRIMPKSLPYSDFSRGNPFSQDALNKTNLQQLYIVQEIFDGYLPEGFFFRVNIDMRGMKIINLGDGVDEGDAVNKKQLDVERNKNLEQDERIVVIEDAIKSVTYVNYVSQLFKASGGETTINTTNSLHAAALYINGIFQHKAAGAYMQTGGVVTLSEPLKASQEVYLILGSELPQESLYPSIESFAALQTLVNNINSNLTALGGRVTTAENNISDQGTRLQTLENSYAKKGANSDITSLSALSTALSVSQGGTGGTTPGAARNGISAAVVGANNDITSLLSLGTNGIKGDVSGASVSAGYVGEQLEVTASSAITPATGVTANASSLVLTPGYWLVSASAMFTIASSSTVTDLVVGVSTTPATLPLWPDTSRQGNKITTSASEVSTNNISTTYKVINVPANTTVYAVVRTAFSAGSISIIGAIRATRIK